MGLRLKGSALAAALLIVVGADGRIVAAPSAATASLARLKAGNARFVANPQEALPVDAGRRAALAKGQTPFATVLSCADSRVPPEIVFHTGLGDLFVVRAAGNITDKAILASLEYSVEHLDVPLVVVMGHESCGAVKAAIETPVGQSLGPNLDYLVSAIRPSVTATASRPEAERMRAAILANVEESLNDMLEGSAILREKGKEGKVAFVGAYYELASGKTYFSEPVTPPPAEPHATGGHQ
ncbi:MAG: carbonic anhydrase [Vicinamibacterales bacterium]